MDFSFLVELGASAKAFFKFMENTQVHELIDNFRPVICFDEEETVYHAIHILSNQRASSAIVTNKQGTLLKFIDLFGMIGLALSVEPLLKNAVDVLSLLREGTLFQDTLLKDVKGQNMVTVQKTSTMLELFDKLEDHVHYVAVLHDSKVIGVLLQSDIASFFVDHHLSFFKVLEISVSEMDWIFHDVVQVQANLHFLYALETLQNENVSAAAVVDSDGKIVGNISTNDVQSVSKAWKFELLTQSVSKYLDFVKQKKSPVVCFQTSSLETVLLKLAYHRIHRVYVIDENLTPIGVVSVTDIVKFFAKFYQETNQIIQTN